MGDGGGPQLRPSKTSNNPIGKALLGNPTECDIFMFVILSSIKLELISVCHALSDM